MSLFDLFKGGDINKSIDEYNALTGALLLDVRTPDEYREGHIPGSVNIPLQSIAMGRTPSDNKNKQIYVYCHSGSRSRQAVSMLKSMGYSNAKNIGGIAAYKGKVER
ncbi:MAG: rhodanese-like domain-containing protein [Clostridia bacterium]|nr:rhodanese-like domain-containing protein [Clostridia bacterium]